ncbi:MAG TPA: hypothetical protein VGB84_03575 [Arachidicoccus sp.]
MLQRVHIRKTLKQLSFFAPVTLYFCLFLLGSSLCYFWLKQQPRLPGTPFHDIFVLLLNITIYASCTLFLFGLITVIISWLYFIIKIKRNKVQFHITTKEFDTPYQPILLSLYPVLRPILGYIKLRFVYDNGDFSDKIQLVEDEHTNWDNKHLDGFYDWKIENIREFRISKVIVYFEDFLQFFSFPYKLSTSERFYTPPQMQRQKAFRAKSRNTEIRKERIDEMRKVEGDLFNYKRFDSNDDVRRIVWKIYAKNKELVIRSPEILEPYASHLYLYVSFFSTVVDEENKILEGPLLNFYKNAVWSVYKNLSSQNNEVRWVSDQPQKSISFSPNPSNEENIKHLIAVSDWQSSNDVLNFVQTKNAAMLIVSSLTNIEQLKQLVEKYNREINFLFVPLSKCFGKQTLFDWIKWIFLQEEKNTSARQKTTWATSAIRRLILKNEKSLKKILASAE